jgi:DNA-binding beta-propeller fold protein YncE
MPGRTVLRAGDGPRELRLTDDGRLLLSANPGSNTLVFIDPGPGLEVGRVNLGEEPSAITLDRSGRRAYVVIHRASQVAIVDLASLAVVGSLGTEALPTRVQLDRSSRRLYVAQAGSPYLAVYRLPALTLDRRVFVGLGASALKVDPRTDLVYVAKEDEGTIQVFDPLSFIPLASIELPGGVAYLTIDDAENTLVALLRERREVAFVDLASRRLLGATDVGADPAFVALLGERN